MRWTVAALSEIWSQEKLSCWPGSRAAVLLLEAHDSGAERTRHVQELLGACRSLKGASKVKDRKVYERSEASNKWLFSFCGEQLLACHWILETTDHGHQVTRHWTLAIHELGVIKLEIPRGVQPLWKDNPCRSMPDTSWRSWKAHKNVANTPTPPASRGHTESLAHTHGLMANSQ